MKFKDFIYNNKTIQQVLGVLFVALVTIELLILVVLFYYYK